MHPFVYKHAIGTPAVVELAGSFTNPVRVNAAAALKFPLTCFHPQPWEVKIPLVRKRKEEKFVAHVRLPHGK